MCPEVLFQPALGGFDGAGIGDAVHASAKECDVDLQAEMYRNIVLAGKVILF